MFEIGRRFAATRASRRRRANNGSLTAFAAAPAAQSCGPALRARTSVSSLIVVSTKPHHAPFRLDIDVAPRQAPRDLLLLLLLLWVCSSDNEPSHQSTTHFCTSCSIPTATRITGTSATAVSRRLTVQQL